MSAPCSHLESVPNDPAPSGGCQECIDMGDTWVHLRFCIECGNIGCCEDSKNTHATKHHHATGHPIIQSYQPGEGWRYCYPDEARLTDAPPMR